MEPQWISLELTCAIHERQLAEHGGQSGVIDFGLLESALARPRQLHAYGDPRPDLCVLAASYAFAITKSHPFIDGNKRTAHVVYRLFLKWNGLAMNTPKEELYFRTLALAAGEIEESAFAAWLRKATSLES
jgi:death-on-curing protein